VEHQAAAALGAAGFGEALPDAIEILGAVIAAGSGARAQGQHLIGFAGMAVDGDPGGQLVIPGEEFQQKGARGGDHDRGGAGRDHHLHQGEAALAGKPG